MSWIFGIIGPKINQEIISKIHKMFPNPLYTYKSKKVYLLCGGLRQTCLSSLSVKKGREKAKGWIVCGLGISSDNNSQKHILSFSDWHKIFKQSEPQLDNLEGHFVAVQWDSEKIFAYVDSRGIRDLYLKVFNDNILISTRLDWFAKFDVKCSVDFFRFGSRWLAFNQLSRRSVVNSVERLGPGGVMYIKDGDYSIHKPEMFSFPQIDKTLEEIIFLLSSFPQKEGYQIILLLSGGIDSRVLLTGLLSIPRSKWQVCIFGASDHSDVKIACSIVKDLNLNYIYFYNKIPDAAHCIRLMSNFAAHTQCIVPVTDVIRLWFYNDLYKEKNIVIDGGFGEIMRRAYFNRLLIKGKSALTSGQPEKIMPHLRIRRADCFCNDVIREMNSGFKEDLVDLWHKLYKINGSNNEKFLDLLAIHTRLPNRFGPEVSRLDHLVLNYMPFAQPSFLSAVQKINLRQKKYGRFSRSFIKKRKYKLTRYHLVKDDEIYPFALSYTILKWLWHKSKNFLSISFQDDLKVKILKILETFIKDTVNSQDTRSFGAYEIKKIDNMINKFYSGDQSYADSLSWWLTFELWRQQIYI